MLRQLLRYCVRNVKLQIPSGPNRDLKWSLATYGRGYGRGTFEPARIAAITSLIEEGECFWDIGAHKGYVSLAAARRVGPKGIVYAFEPVQENLWFLKNHIEWNQVQNTHIVPVAISDFDGQMAFGGGSSLSHKLGQGDSKVEVRSIARLVEDGTCRPPTFLKIDVEGAEVEVLEGGGRHLSNPRLLMMVATHGPGIARRCAYLLQELGLQIYFSASLTAAWSEGWEGHGDPDILAVGPARPAPAGVIENFVKECA